MTGHGLRALIINTLKVNGVNAMEVAQAARHKSLNSQNSYNRATDAATENNKQAALRPSAGRKRAMEEDHTMAPRKTTAAAAIPSPAKSVSPATQKLQLEVESLRMQLQLATGAATAAPPMAAQHAPPQGFYYQYPPQAMGPPPPPHQTMYQHHPYAASGWGMQPPLPPPTMYQHHPYAGGWGMQLPPPPPPPPPPTMYRTNYQPYYHQAGAYPHGHAPSMPVQSSIPYQTQPPAMMPAHTGRPTQQYHSDLQHEVVQYHGQDHQSLYGEYHHPRG